jgi:DNA-binding transcriptional regulator LsrR (DeoR family)
MRTRRTVVPAITAAARAAVAIICIGALGACASIPQRAWRNGEAMTQSRAYQAVMSGNMSFQVHRQLQQSLDPLRLNYREVAFPPFGQWW